MNKPALTDLDLHPLIKNRFSPRAFNGQAVEEDKIERILEAARWAPSANNDQPWRFIVGTNFNEQYDRIYNALVEFNQIWNKNVPVLIVICATEISEKSGKHNDYHAYDAGQSAAYMTIQAMEEGLLCHQMGGFSKEKISESFQLPDNIRPIAVMAVGYQGDITVLPERMQKGELSPRTRFPLKKLILKK